jgi:type II secretory pathway pseudopilin PulG
MLTVIGIIVLLAAILLPVVSSVRNKAHATSTGALLANIAAGMERYYADHRAYPGPLSNGQIAGGGVPVLMDFTNLPASTPPPPETDPLKITQAENVVLGLLGGVKPHATTAGRVVFDPNLIGTGVLSLNPRNPKRYPAYMNKTDLSEGDFSDGVGDADDTVIPEWVDRFPDPMPILILRAKVGASGIVSDAPDATQQQYDLKQIKAYTSIESGRTIGVGRVALSVDEIFPRPSGNPPPQAELIKHGLRTVTNNTTSVNPAPTGQQYRYPYDLYGFMRHPSLANMPRQKDGYILISAGQDRIYGTRDDVVNPPIK